MRNKLKKPDLSSEDFDGNKAYYDFSTRPISENMVKGAKLNLGNETRMTT